LILAALASIPFNAQDDRLLLSVPLGVGWLALGMTWAVREKDLQAACVIISSLPPTPG
jgi:hypothetical protein